MLWLVRDQTFSILLTVELWLAFIYGSYNGATKSRPEQQRRLEFLERQSSDLPVHSVALAIARLAGRTEGQQEAIGVQLTFEDLLIGATALTLGYDVATLNLRDFQKIHGLPVIQLRTIDRQRNGNFAARADDQVPSSRQLRIRSE